MDVIIHVINYIRKGGRNGCGWPKSREVPHTDDGDESDPINNLTVDRVHELDVSDPLCDTAYCVTYVL